MQVVYAREPFPTTVTRSIFLAGPTPRHPDVESWRPKMLEVIEKSELGADVTVFVPEDRHGRIAFDYTDQVEWEEAGLNRADCVLFWVPRDMATMPALTTNVEFGMWHDTGKIVLGVPPLTPDGKHLVGNKYLAYMAKKFHVKACETMEETVQEAIKRIPVQAKREGGECEIPFHVWQTESFQAWYRGQKAAGHRMDGARVVWFFGDHSVSPVRPKVWALHANMHVAGEDRNMKVEAVVARSDISTVVLYKRALDVWDTEVVLVREYRVAVRNKAGFVYECPGGSSPKVGTSPYQTAVDEVREETGLSLSEDQIVALEDRQLYATLAPHKSHLFMAELTDEQLQQVRDNYGKVFGADDDERTTTHIYKLSELFVSNIVDWSTIGMVLRAVLGPNRIIR